MNQYGTYTMEKQKVMQNFLPDILFICCVITAISATTVLGEEVKPASMVLKETLKDSGVGLSSGDDDRDENIIKDQNHGTQITKHFLFDDFKSMESILVRLKRVETKVEMILENLQKPNDNEGSQDSLKNIFLESAMEERQQDKIGRQDVLQEKLDDLVQNKLQDLMKEGPSRSKKAARLLPLSLLVGKNEEQCIDPPTNCKDLNCIGYTLNGFYNVKNPKFGKMETIYCDFKQQPSGNAGGNIVEKRIGFINIQSLTGGVYFYVQRKSKFVGNGVTVTFEVEKLNVAGGMNLKTGVFAAPVPGIYFFSFIGIKDYSNMNPIEMTLRLNNMKVGMAVATGGLGSFSISIHATLKLKAGDRVYLVKEMGNALDDDARHLSHFSGHLLQEELVVRDEQYWGEIFIIENMLHGLFNKSKW